MCLAGCTENPDSKVPDESSKPLFPYPKTVAEVKSNKDFAFYHKGEKSGIEYYIMKIKTEDLEKYSYSDPIYKYTIQGPKISRVYVPVKDNQIVEVELSDAMAITMKAGTEDANKE
jgi:hypothetical protein